MKRIMKKWLGETDASAAIEAGLLFPVMITMLLGTIDIGMGLTVNEKVTNACHSIADLLARYDDINNAALNDSIVGGELILQPYDATPMGYDVAGIQFINATLTPTEKWRDTFQMS